MLSWRIASRCAAASWTTASGSPDPSSIPEMSSQMTFSNCGLPESTRTVFGSWRVLTASWRLPV